MALKLKLIFTNLIVLLPGSTDNLPQSLSSLFECRAEEQRGRKHNSRCVWLWEVSMVLSDLDQALPEVVRSGKPEGKTERRKGCSVNVIGEDENVCEWLETQLYGRF